MFQSKQQWNKWNECVCICACPQWKGDIYDKKSFRWNKNHFPSLLPVLMKWKTMIDVILLISHTWRKFSLNSLKMAKNKTKNKHQHTLTENLTKRYAVCLYVVLRFVLSSLLANGIGIINQIKRRLLSKHTKTNKKRNKTKHRKEMRERESAERRRK